MAVFFVLHLNILNKNVAGAPTVVESKLESANDDVRKNVIKIWLVSSRNVYGNIVNISDGGRNVNH